MGGPRLESSPMPETEQHRQRICFGEFEADLRSGELRRAGMKLKLTGQPFQLLAILLERPGEAVTREELQKRLWPNTFVDVERNLNTAINKIREALGDSAESPRFIETLPRRGYRFIATVEPEISSVQEPVRATIGAVSRPRRHWLYLCLGVAVFAFVSAFVYRSFSGAKPPQFSRLTRLTFDSGLQSTPALSPDGRYVAFSSNRSGNSDLWVQPTDGSGSPIRVTDGISANWEPEWSPDGRYLAYRSEADGGGLFIVPALGGIGLQRKVATFGHFPHWSPDGSKLLFQTHHFGLGSRIFLIDVRDGTEPREVLATVTSKADILSAAWHPDGKRVSLWGWEFVPSPIPTFWTGSTEQPNPVIKTAIPPDLINLAELEAGAGYGGWADSDSRFSWDHSGTNVYFERMFRGARNIWRMQVDPRTLKAIQLDRITNGTELASDFALSADNSKLVFTSKEQSVREWIFDLSRDGRWNPKGKPITPAGMEAWEGDLSPDGARVAFSCKRAGQWNLCQEALSDASVDVIASDDAYIRDEPHWSRDGDRLAYVRLNKQTAQVQVVTWDRATRQEHTVSDLQHKIVFVYDWSPDQNWLAVSVENPENGQIEIWKYRADGVSSPNDARKIVTLGPDASLYQARYSPDGNWITFDGITSSDRGDRSAIYVARSTGGSPIRLTDGQTWQDKPRWSSDGKRIYFVAERNGFLNVFSVGFDPARGRSDREVRQLTDFHSPEFVVAGVIPSIGFSLVNDKLMLTMAQTSGGVWLLDSPTH